MQANIALGMLIFLIPFACRCRLLSSADNLCNLFGPRSGGPVLDKTLLDTLIVLFLKDFVLNEEKNTDDKKHASIDTQHDSSVSKLDIMVLIDLF